MRSILIGFVKPAFISTLLFLLPPATAAGQGNQASGSPDFLFGRPRGFVAFKAGLLVPREQGDLFSFVREQLTVDKGDFRSGTAGGVLGVNVASRATLTFECEFSNAATDSESREYIGSDGLPIAQTTSLATQNLSVGVKIALLSPGRQISRFAWIPRAVVPYVGGGFGGAHYSIKQEGEFVDFNTLHIFEHEFTSSDWGAAGHAFGGVDWRFSRKGFVGIEGRYVWANASVGEEFLGFDGIDLAGFRFAATIGVSF